MIHYLIAEDEPILRQRLVRMLQEIKPEWRLAGQTSGVKDTLDLLQEKKVDLIFLDIELADGNCFEILERMRLEQPIIFTTAYDQYALDAFRTDCVDYLIKPITRKKLETALEKLERLAHFPNTNLQETEVTQRILIPSATGFSVEDPKDVAWLSKKDRYTEIVTFKQRHYLLDKSLDTFEHELDHTYFFRTSRNCLLNRNAICNIQRHTNGRLRVTTNPPSDFEILVTQVRRKDFLQWMKLRT